MTVKKEAPETVETPVSDASDQIDENVPASLIDQD